MKKLVSLFSAIAIGSSALYFPSTANAVDSKGKLLVLGDSISSGYGLSDEEYNYGEILGEYLDYDVNNLAVSGITTADLLNQLDNSEYRNAISDADMIVISIGGNDFIQTAKNIFSENYDGIDDITDLTKIFEVLSSDQEKALTIINDIYDTEFPQACDTAISNIEQISSTISSLNSDAVVVFQNIYDPFQLTEEKYEKYIDGNTKNKMGYRAIKRAVYYNVCTENTYDSTAVPVSFNVRIKDAVGSAYVADVYNSFTSDTVPESDLTQAYGNVSYFTNIFETEKDFHPNQKGQLEIASTILETINAEPVVSRKMRYVYNHLTSDEKTSYPSLRVETVQNYADVESSILKGDYNNDGIVNASDASDALSYYGTESSGSTVDISKDVFVSVDIDGNDVINASDASSILSYYAKISAGEGTGWD